MTGYNYLWQVNFLNSLGIDRCVFYVFSEGKSYNPLKHCEQHNQKKKKKKLPLPMLILCIKIKTIHFKCIAKYAYTKMSVFWESMGEGWS